MPDIQLEPLVASRVSLKKTLVRYLGYLLLTALVCQGLYWSLLLEEIPRFSETSFVELAQTAALAASLACLWCARRKGLYSYGIPLLFGWLLASLVREQDAMLDSIIDDLWQWCVGLIALVTVTHTVRHRRRIARELGQFIQESAFGLFMGGFFTVYVFSRLMGRHELWQAVLGSAYEYRIKSGVEESLELMGYLLMLYACIELWARARERHQGGKGDARRVFARAPRLHTPSEKQRNHA
ncbi:hypothetical protein [Larsenimonas rhizosphaerae]|uniref:Uncharacterized protein n=1 Tax=Larsenimonas rhizosphaerae TaxID=2944682 RepID=A0AA41ZNX3_9GAMM|nr:hypothetical protein [Larsenimonas rhizosphaerae]MCM2131238.1 hypothetical protein [Larsenimonas rhizosphaerae]MCX2525403.1 hypothetical protein [Larsenimonas rhizosphaerae]